MAKEKMTGEEGSQMLTKHIAEIYNTLPSAVLTSLFLSPGSVNEMKLFKVSSWV